NNPAIPARRSPGGPPGCAASFLGRETAAGEPDRLMTWTPGPALAAAAAGAASLAVELVWMRILSLTFGSASIAAGSVVAALMLGMALGRAGAARRPGAPLAAVLLALSGAAAVSGPLLRFAGSLGPASVVAAS